MVKTETQKEARNWCLAARISSPLSHGHAVPLLLFEPEKSFSETQSRNKPFGLIRFAAGSS